LINLRNWEKGKSQRDSIYCSDRGNREQRAKKCKDQKCRKVKRCNNKGNTSVLCWGTKKRKRELPKEEFHLHIFEVRGKQHMRKGGHGGGRHIAEERVERRKKENV